MRKTALVLIFALVLAAVPAMAGSDAKGKTHDVTAEVVAVDMEAKTITIKNADGTTMTAPVMGQAVVQLKEVKTGQKVSLTCKDKENGDHEGVTFIKKVS
jgi:Cu/Ag efflux protein CusF